MAKKLMMATIDLLIEVEDDDQDEGRAADLIGESLRPLLREYSDMPSDVIDWRYSGGPEGYAEDHDGTGFEIPQGEIVTNAPTVMDVDPKDALWALAQTFINEQHIRCGETIYQSDRVIQNGYEFIHEVCKTVGFFKDPDDEGDAE